MTSSWQNPATGSRPQVVADEVTAAYASGKPVDAIAGWFGITADEVRRIVSADTDLSSHAAPEPRRGPRRWPFLVAVVVLLVAAAGAIMWGASRSDKSRNVQSNSPVSPTSAEVLQTAKDTCAASEAGVQVTDGGTTLLFDSAGKEDFTGAPVSSLACVLQTLKAPSAVVAHMDSTRALDGRQEDSWPGYAASWSYHPDNGLDLIVRAV